MIAKYAGTCRRCHGTVNVGEHISWSRKQRGVVYHITCPNGERDTSGETIAEESNHDESQSDYTKGFAELNQADYEPYEAPKPESKQNGHTGNLEQAIAQAIAGYLPKPDTTPAVDESLVRSIIKTEIDKITFPTRVEVVTGAPEQPRDMGVQHKQFPLLLKVLSVPGINVWLAGPSGAGKTQAAQNVSDALGHKFYFCGAQSNEYGLLGYRDANGFTIRTLFREAYEHGGTFLFDEIDASAPSAVLAFNAALANGHCAFPDAVVSRHPDCTIIAAANTFGLGATNDYVGRMKQDAAFIDRFIFLTWETDEALETAIAGNTEWSKHVQRVRSKAKSKGVKAIISPRASIFGAKLLAAGVDMSDVEALVLRKGMDATTWESIQ